MGHPEIYPEGDAHELFRSLGVERFDCLDIKSLNGCEIVADLNRPQELGPYDLVIDNGTLEHCFNIGQAALNAAHAVKVGGYIFHGNPISMVNHGFYMLSPTWYADFYKDNGWELERFQITDHVTKAEPIKNLYARLKVAPELSNLVVAKRTSDQPMQWPTQTKYKEMLS